MRIANKTHARHLYVFKKVNSCSPEATVVKTFKKIRVQIDRVDNIRRGHVTGPRYWPHKSMSRAVRGEWSRNERGTGGMGSTLFAFQET